MVSDDQTALYSLRKETSLLKIENLIFSVYLLCYDRQNEHGDYVVNIPLENFRNDFTSYH